MSASPKPFAARAAFPALQNLPLPEIDSFRATVFDTVRFARFALRGQVQKPVDMASALLPQALAAPMRDVTQFGFKVGDAVEQAVGRTVYSLKNRLLPDEEAILSPLE